MKRIFSSKRDSFPTKVCIFVMTATLIAGMAGCDGYTPTSKDLEIWDWYDLDDIRDNLYGDHTLMNDLDSTTSGYAKLASEAANGGRGWQPIGSSEYVFFNGAFDGQGYEIRDLFINRPGEDYVGLFGYVEAGDIQDIGVVNATVIGAKLVGGLVGFNRGTLSNSYSTGSVSGAEYDTYVGGLVGDNIDGTVSNCHSSCTVTGDQVGGLVGRNIRPVYTTAIKGIVSNSYSTGNLTGNTRVGGLVGENSGTVINSYSTGSVTGNEQLGGLVGFNSYRYDGTVINSYYNYDEVLINGENIITLGALFDEDFEQWLANDNFLDCNERFSQENGYYVVNNVTDLKQLLAFGQNATLKFRLNSDLDLGDEPDFFIPCLAGEFDGNGHKISNLSFNFGFVYNVALFGYLAPGGYVTALAAENVKITGYENVGGLVGNNYGTVGNSSSSGSVAGQQLVGGLVGLNEGTVSNSYSTGTVTGDEFAIGGLVGQNHIVGNVSNSYSTGTVIGGSSAGGLVGSNGGTVSNSYSTGTVTGDNFVGGLVGRKFDSWLRPGGGTAAYSYWDTQTSGHTTSDGGIGKTTAQMQDIATFSGAGWDITTVADPSTRNTDYIWNIVDDETYPFLSWQAI